MWQHIRPAVIMTIAMTVLTGLVYPLAVTGIAEAVFPHQARGSLIVRDGAVVGSELIGQTFAGPTYFHGRPSATTDTDPNDATKTVPAPYNAANSSGSNLGPLNPDLAKRVGKDAEALRKDGATGPIPADALTTSGSGLDPAVSPATTRRPKPSVAS